MMVSFTPRWRLIFGALLLDAPRFIVCLLMPAGWRRMRNRKDSVRFAPDGRGVACEWEYTRTLHICDVFPRTSVWLLRRALQECPVRLQTAPEHVGEDAVCWNGAEQAAGDLTPQVSFLIGHRGLERLPLLLWTLQSIAAQEQIRFECIVVEQSADEQIRDALPSWVRYQHQPVDAEMPYNRSSTFNLAATLARAPLLVFHDNDMIIPACYGKELFERFEQGYEVINLKRFIFYLDKTSTDRFPVGHSGNACKSESVVENLEGGGSVAASAQAFGEIGGFDDEFVGWGGEDDEFWDRCQTRKVWEYTGLPILHLWHASQPGKRAKGGRGETTAELIEARMSVPPLDRIAVLIKKERGSLGGAQTSAGRQGLSPAESHYNEFISRGYRQCEEIYPQHNAHWKTYWKLERNDGVQCFSKVNYGYDDAAINVIMGRKEASLSEYFQQFIHRTPGCQVPLVLDHWESYCGYFVVYEWLELQSLPLVSILESAEMTGLLTELLLLLDGIPPPPFWSKDMVIHDFGCEACYPADGCEMAPFGFDLDDNLSFSQTSGKLVVHDFEFIQWVARGLQGTYITLKCLHEFRKHLVKVVRSESSVRRVAATVQKSLRRVRMAQAAEVLVRARQRKHRWTAGARLRLELSRWVATRLP